MWECLNLFSTTIFLIYLKWFLNDDMCDTFVCLIFKLYFYIKNTCWEYGVTHMTLHFSFTQITLYTLKVRWEFLYNDLEVYKIEDKK